MENTRRPLVAIILNWNGSALLRKFLPEVIANTNAALTHIVVADNGSTDDSLNVLNKEFSGKIEIMKFDSNLGFAAGYNRAITEIGDYKYVALINSDLATDPGWDSSLIRFMDANPSVGAVQPKILSYNEPTHFEYAGACGGLLDRNGYPYCRGRIFGTCEPDNSQYNTPKQIFWASGAALVVRRDIYMALGGFDPSFFAHMEEIDLCWRIQLAGFKVAVVPEASVRHLGGGSLPMGNPRKTYLNFRNNLLMMHKNLPDDVRSKMLFKRRLLDTIAWVKSVITLNFGDAGAILRAHRDYAKMRGNYAAHPKENLLKSTIDTQRNILWQYFCRRHTTYDKLLPKSETSTFK